MAKRITSMARVIEIFSSEPIDQCQLLLEAAQGIVRNRKGGAPKTTRRRTPKANTETTTSEGTT